MRADVRMALGMIYPNPQQPPGSPSSELEGRKSRKSSLTCMEPVRSGEGLLAQPWQGVLKLHRGGGAGCGVWGAAGMSICLLPFPACRKGRHCSTGRHTGILHEDAPAWNGDSAIPRSTPAAPGTHSCAPGAECGRSLGATRTAQSKGMDRHIPFPRQSPFISHLI